jgi:hypothetical protein
VIYCDKNEKKKRHREFITKKDFYRNEFKFVKQKCHFDMKSVVSIDMSVVLSRKCVCMLKAQV